MQNSNDVAFNLKYHKIIEFSNQTILEKDFLVGFCKVRDNDQRKTVTILIDILFYNFDIKLWIDVMFIGTIFYSK